MTDTKFKKYKNRKIYSITQSRYATLAEVYYAALSGSVSVVDSSTNEDITAETVLHGALEVLGTEALKDLWTEAVVIGRKYDLKLNPDGSLPTVSMFEGYGSDASVKLGTGATLTPELLEEVAQRIAKEGGSVPPKIVPPEEVDDLFAPKIN